MHILLSDTPGLAVAAFVTRFDASLGDTLTPEAVVDLLRLDASAPLARDENVRLAVRDLLRSRGYKPTGRGKPASEYLVKAAESGFLGPINAAVDACNAASLHSGLPISVVSLDRARGPFTVRHGASGEHYVFNASGHEIKLDGLLCLCDAAGPCANPVRDSQRTKTHDGTRETLSIVWAPEAYTDRLAQTAAWYHSLLEASGATTETLSATA